MQPEIETRIFNSILKYHKKNCVQMCSQTDHEQFKQFAIRAAAAREIIREIVYTAIPEAERERFISMLQNRKSALQEAIYFESMIV